MSLGAGTRLPWEAVIPGGEAASQQENQVNRRVHGTNTNTIQGPRNPPSPLVLEPMDFSSHTASQNNGYFPSFPCYWL